jgi:hypothetical protein
VASLHDLQLCLTALTQAPPELGKKFREDGKCQEIWNPANGSVGRAYCPCICLRWHIGHGEPRLELESPGNGFPKEVAPELCMSLSKRGGQPR